MERFAACSSSEVLKKNFPAMFIKVMEHSFSKIQALEESGKKTLSCALDNISLSLSALKSQHETELDEFVGTLEEKQELKRNLLVIRVILMKKDMERIMEETFMMEMNALKMAQKSEFHAFIEKVPF